MDIEGVESLLSRLIGLDPSSVSRAGILRACKTQMEQAGLDSTEQFIRLVESDPEARTKFIEAVLVPETWFFRDAGSFKSLARHAGSLIANGRIKVLSIPCSTGEEPYSIAITLMEAGFKPENILVDAADVSRAALDAARRGVYPRSSFRVPLSNFQAGFFSLDEKKEAVVSPKLRSIVRFFHANVLDQAAFSRNSPYDVIFFRNVLIYLNARARELAIGHLRKALAPGGMLVLGYAESRATFFPDFQCVDIPRAYACIKPACGKAVEPGPATRIKICRSGLGSMPVQKRNSFSRRMRRAKDAQMGLGSDFLSRAFALAGRGRMEEAAEKCGQVLEHNPADPQALYLMALISLSRHDDRQAMIFFNKTLYVKPDHMEALHHMMMLMEKHGQNDQAARFRHRLERVRQKEAMAT